MRVLLVSPPFNSVDAPPLGLAYLATYLREDRYKVSVLDLNTKLFKKLSHFYQSPRKLRETWSDDPVCYKAISELLFSSESQTKLSMPFWKAVSKYILIKEFLNQSIESIKGKYDVVGFSMMDVGLLASLYLSKKLKEHDPNVKIIWGGASIKEPIAKAFLSIFDFVDIMVCGEGEETLKEILAHLKTKSKLDDIKGIIYRAANDIIVNEPRLPKPNLNNLPIPDYSGFDLKDYNLFIMPIQGSRGCSWNRCVFCGDKHKPPPFVTRPPQEVVEEMFELNKRYHSHYFYLVDEVANGNPRHLMEICNILIEKRAKFRWTCLMRSKGVTRELLSRMHRAGCSHIFIGVESFSDNTLQRMRKGCTKLDHIKVFKYAWENRMSVETHFIVFFPPETEKDIKETLTTLKRYNHLWKYSVFHLSIFTVDQDSYVMLHPQEFGIKLLDCAHFSEYYPEDIRQKLVFYDRNWTFVDEPENKVLAKFKLYSQFERFIQKLERETIPDVYYCDYENKLVIYKDDRQRNIRSTTILKGPEREIFLLCDDTCDLKTIVQETQLETKTIRQILHKLETESFLISSNGKFLNTVPNLENKLKNQLT